MNVVALGGVFGLFLWANTRPESFSVEFYDGQNYSIIYRGPGWPLAVQGRGDGFHIPPVPADTILRMRTPPEDQARERATAWLVNSPIGVLLFAALVLNARRLFTHPAHPGEP